MRLLMDAVHQDQGDVFGRQAQLLYYLQQGSAGGDIQRQSLVRVITGDEPAQGGEEPDLKRHGFYIMLLPIAKSHHVLWNTTKHENRQMPMRDL